MRVLRVRPHECCVLFVYRSVYFRVLPVYFRVFRVLADEQKNHGSTEAQRTGEKATSDVATGDWGRKGTIPPTPQADRVIGCNIV